MTMDLDAGTAGAGSPGGHVTSGTPTLEARGLVKTFGHVVGLAGVSLQLYPGEVLAIIGDNGAGKSTLIKCLSGALAVDEGEILMDGVKVDFKSPVDARHAGIETVFQTLAVAPALDIASNLYLGREIRDKGPLGTIFRKLDTRGMRAKAKEQLKDLGIGTIQDLSQKVETLSGGQRQAVAVARAAAFGSKVVILDEPTAALGVTQTALVLDLIRRLADRGIAVLVVSHNLTDVFQVANRMAVLYLGGLVSVGPASEYDTS
ncbi:MAG TPA: ATP-binding cassette domain-containing protein, partial [Streptosporangiaceae bacterium]|nr:ATP-binding cassette domain-containing protein [Streptosporangiaceae bacterium]